MLQAPHPKGQKKPRGGWPRKFPIPLRKAAAALGCNHSHLYRVITGQRESRSLMRRWNELQSTTK